MVQIIKSRYTAPMSEPQQANRLVELFKNHSIVVFVIPGVGESVYNTIDFKEVIDGIEARLDNEQTIQSSSSLSTVQDCLSSTSKSK